MRGAYEYSAGGGQKKALDPLKLELQSVVSHLMLVIETKLKSSLKNYKCS